MTATLLPNGRMQICGYSGSPAVWGPLVGGKIYTYIAGTTTAKATYTTAAATVANTNPVILDSRGEATIFFSGAYKIVVKDSAGNTLYTVDNVTTAIDALAVTYFGDTLSAILLDYLPRSVDTISDLRNVDSTAYTAAIVKGYYAANDGGGGHYYYDSSDTTSTDNGGTIIVAADDARWKLITFGQIVDLRQFGAVDDWATDSTSYVAKAITWAIDNGQSLRVAGRIYCASDINPSGIKLVGDYAGWNPGTNVTAIEDYPSVLLLGSSKISATTGGMTLDGILVVQKNIAQGGTYPLPWANGTVAGNAVAAYSGTAIQSTGVPSKLHNVGIVGFALGLSGNITGTNVDIDCTAAGNLSLEAQDLQYDLVGFNCANFIAPTLSTVRTGAGLVVTSDAGYNLINSRVINYAGGSSFTTAAGYCANITDCDLYNSASASDSTVSVEANSNVFIKGGSVKSGGAFAPIRVESGARYLVDGCVVGQTSTENITLASGASYGSVQNCYYSGTLLGGDATAILKCAVGSQLIASAPIAFTPILTIGGVTTGIVYSRQHGHYVINGNVVTGTIDILLTNMGSGTGAVKLTALPRTATATTYSDGSFCAEEWACKSGTIGASIPTGRIIAGTSEIVFRYGSGSASVALTDAEIDNNFAIRGTFTYLIDY